VEHTDPARNGELWASVFGSAPDYWGWTVIEFLEGDWDTPGRAKVTIIDPDDPTYVVAVRELTMDHIWEALDKAVAARYTDVCTGRPIHETCEWDACTSDVILQLAVLGEIMYS
jgi:hypothetical protein